jgi:hypothetical protein
MFETTVEEQTMKLLMSILVLMYVVGFPARAQWIQIRTVPVVAANQGEFYPSLARGMGNLTFTLDDPLGASFMNPAKASLVNGIVLFSSPTRAGWSNDNGRAVTSTQGSSLYTGTALSSIPFGTLMNFGSVFGGAVVAYQGYKGDRTRQPFPWVGPLDVIGPSAATTDLGANTFVTGVLGYQTPDKTFAVGASASWGELSAIDGVNLLYPGATDIRQSGKVWDVKLGVLADLPDGDRLEFVAGRGISKATHEVSYPTFRGPVLGVVKEMNKDETREWLLHAVYLRPVGEHWKIGGALTVNWKDHPKIPNYALANIPRDPGTSIAYNLGLGIRWSNERSFWGFEYVYEPITVNTWAEAGEQQGGIAIRTLPPDFKTVENFFDFANHSIRVGHSSISKWEWLEYRLGAQLHFYKYDLHQIDNIAHTARDFSTDWLETTLTGGLTARVGRLRLLYTLQLVLGNGLVGVSAPRFLAAPDGGVIRTNFDVLPAPAGELVVDDITLVTHQFVFVYELD